MSDKLKINIPEGKEIDIKKSSLETGEIYFKDKELTLEDIIEKSYNIHLNGVKCSEAIYDLNSCKGMRLIAKMLYCCLRKYFNYKKVLNVSRTFKVLYNRVGDNFFIKDSISNSNWFADHTYIYNLSDAYKIAQIMEDNKDIFRYLFI